MRLLITVVITGLLTAEPAFSQPARLDRNQLLQYRDAARGVQPVTSADEWQKRRAVIIQGMIDVMGAFPGPERRVDTNLQILEEADVGSYVRRLVTYESDSDCPTPAYLCIPKDVLAGETPGGGRVVSASDRQHHGARFRRRTPEARPGNNTLRN